MTAFSVLLVSRDLHGWIILIVSICRPNLNNNSLPYIFIYCVAFASECSLTDSTSCMSRISHSPHVLSKRTVPELFLHIAICKTHLIPHRCVPYWSNIDDSVRVFFLQVGLSNHTGSRWQSLAISAIAKIHCSWNRCSCMVTAYQEAQRTVV